MQEKLGNNLLQNPTPIPIPFSSQNGRPSRHFWTVMADRHQISPYSRMLTHTTNRYIYQSMVQGPSLFSGKREHLDHGCNRTPNNTRNKKKHAHLHPLQKGTNPEKVFTKCRTVGNTSHSGGELLEDFLGNMNIAATYITYGSWENMAHDILPLLRLIVGHMPTHSGIPSPMPEPHWSSQLYQLATFINLLQTHLVKSSPWTIHKQNFLSCPFPHYIPTNAHSKRQSQAVFEGRNC